MQCDLCGKQGEMFKTEIEGTTMTTCQECSKYGKVHGRLTTRMVQPKKEPQHKRMREEPMEVIVKNYSKIIKTAREKQGLKQKELAQQLNEKESVIHAIESGHREPRTELARKLEKFFNIQLVEIYAEEDLKSKGAPNPATSDVTLGDMITIRKRKKTK